MTEREAKIFRWGCERFPYVPVEDLKLVASIELPADRLIAHLQSVYDEKRPYSFRFFTSPIGIGELRELESEERARWIPKHRPGQLTQFQQYVWDEWARLQAARHDGYEAMRSRPRAESASPGNHQS